MGLSVTGKWLWDFWFAQDGKNYHIFYLQADNQLEHERLRHFNVSIGHAVSTDLRHWEILPDAIQPSSSAKIWDNKTTWTGSIIKDGDQWYMFYTGSMVEDEGLVQRIGVATSRDLINWEKHPDNPLMEAAESYYERLDLAAWHDEAWRDPHVLQDEHTGRYHVFITARINSGPADERGVIGHAISDDLLDWEIRPPITSPGEFGHLEVPQIVQIGKRYYLIFCCPYENASIKRRKRTADNPQSGTFYLMSDNLTGPYTWDTEGCLFADEYGSLYSGKLIQGPDKLWYYIAFRNYDQQGNFIGKIIDPLPIKIDTNGHITVQS